MKKAINKNIRWIILLFSVIIIIAITQNLLQKNIENFDNTIYNFISNFISPQLSSVVKIITTLGSVYVIIPVYIILVILFWKKKEAIWITINLFVIFIGNQILKYIVARPRPTVYRIVEELGYSFPSGHSMVSTAFYGLLIYLIYRKVEKKSIKWTACITLGLIIVLIGLSRIYLGVHYASDVIAGFCISLAYLCLFTHIVKDKIAK